MDSCETVLQASDWLTQTLLMFTCLWAEVGVGQYIQDSLCFLPVKLLIFLFHFHLSFCVCMSLSGFMALPPRILGRGQYCVSSFPSPSQANECCHPALSSRHSHPADIYSTTELSLKNHFTCKIQQFQKNAAVVSLTNHVLQRSQLNLVGLL